MCPKSHSREGVGYGFEARSQRPPAPRSLRPFLAPHPTQRAWCESGSPGTVQLVKGGAASCQPAPLSPGASCQGEQQMAKAQGCCPWPGKGLASPVHFTRQGLEPAVHRSLEQSDAWLWVTQQVSDEAGLWPDRWSPSPSSSRCQAWEMHPGCGLRHLGV